MFGLSRILTVYMVAIPVALILGYLLSTPDQMTYVMVGLVIFSLALPIFIQWHHILLICFWNSAFNFPFLPSQPHFWLLLALMSFGISWLNGLLTRTKFLRVPELTRPLILLGIIVIATGYLRGGIGVSALNNSSYGGRAYIYIIGAIVGYFAFTSSRIPLAKAARLMGVFNISGTTYVLSNIAFLLGPAFYFVYYLLPAQAIGTQSETVFDPGSQSIVRFEGVAPACDALIFYFLVRWGLQGVFSFAKPWRTVLFLSTVGLSMLSGFRGNVIMLGLLIGAQFIIEGLWRTKYMAVMLIGGALAAILVVVDSDRMPLVVQRAICFLPVKVDPSVSADAQGSIEWRLDMWRIVVPQIPNYLILGKGYAIDPTELYFAALDPEGTAGTQAAALMIAGDYHSGPLSTIIPLGLAGLMAFLWFLGAGLKVLYQNFTYGVPELKRANAFLFAYFIAQAIYFFGVFGSFYSQLFIYTGVLGMSVALNGGVVKSRQKQLSAVSLPDPIQTPFPAGVQA